MKRILLFTLMLALATGCVSGVKKSFKVIVEPPDAQITVIPGGDQPEQKYRSPADITVFIPKDPAEASKGRMEIKRETYKPMTIILNSIQGQTIRLKLDKMVHYALKFRLIGPARSEELSYRDKILDIQLIPGERQFNLKIQNLSQKPVKLLWEKAEYTDYWNRQHRLIHSGVKPQNRNNAVPPQEIPAGETLVQHFMPVSGVTYSQEKKSYDTKPLFPLDSESAPGLKGRTFTVFLPVEMDRAIIPDYMFRFEISDVIKE